MLIIHYPAATRRFLTIAALLLIGLVADTVLNHLNVHGLSNFMTWDYPRTLPTLGEPGADLRILMHGAEQITHGIDPYSAAVAYPPPPFAAVFFYPYTHLSSRTAYLVQYWVLITLNLASIGLIAACLFRSSAESGGTEVPEFHAVATGVLVTIVALSGQLRGYGLEFALERGNFDSYVLFLVAAAITYMIARPERVLLPIILLSAASHLKIYPAILLVLPLLQCGRRALAPTVAVNLAMLFVFGLRPARAFLDQIFRYIDTPYIWPGNHSIAAYVNQVIVPAFPAPVHDPGSVQAWASRGIALVVVGLWIHGMIRLRNLMPSSRRWLIMAALSFPVMGALSSTSHDYKLLIDVLPALVNLYLYCEAYLAFGSSASVLGIVLTLVCGVAINHSTILGSWPLLETKFPVLFLLLLVTYFQTYVSRVRSPRHPAVSPSSSGRSGLALPILAVGAIAVGFVVYIVVSPNRQVPARQIPASVVAQVANSAGYGEIKLQLKLPGTSAGIPEPILVCGHPGNATLVYVRLLTNSQIKVGVEFWGMGAFESAPFEVLSPNCFITVICAFPCLYPDLGDPEWQSVPDPAQRARRKTYSITVNDVRRLAGPLSYAQPAHSPRFYGVNPVGGSLVSGAFTGNVVSAIQIAK